MKVDPSGRSVRRAHKQTNKQGRVRCIFFSEQNLIHSLQKLNATGRALRTDVNKAITFATCFYAPVYRTRGIRGIK